MLSYEEALKVWASRRFGLDLDLIRSVKLEEVEAQEDSVYGERISTPAHVAVHVWPHWKDLNWRHWNCHYDLTGASLVEIIYEVIAAGLEEL